MPIIDTKTDHAEKFVRPDPGVRRGWFNRKPTDIRRLELRRARRVRRVEVAQLAANDCTERGEIVVGALPCLTSGCQGHCHCCMTDYDYDDGYDDAWDYYCWGTPEDAEAERERFRVTIAEVA